jgi:hypothetical protein
MIVTNATMLEMASIKSRLEIPCKENIPFMADDKSPKTANNTRETDQALKMFLA